MKGFLTCAVCFVSLPVYALTLYYDKSGTCDGLYPTNSCNATPVTHLNVTSTADSVFNGYYINNQQVVDSDGNVLPNAASVLRGANLGAGSKVPQNYTCPNGVKNPYGACVNEGATYVNFDEGAYIDENYEVSIPNGYEVPVNEIGKNGNDRGGSYYSDFKVQFHWCPESYQAYTWTWNDGKPGGWSAAAAPDWTGINCNEPSVTYQYHWARDGSAGTYRPVGGGDIVKKLEVPAWAAQNGWTLRGFYLLKYPTTPGVNCPSGTITNPSQLPHDCVVYYGYKNTVAKNLITYGRTSEQDNSSTWGTARLGLTKKSNDTSKIPLEDLGRDDIDNTNTRWAIWSNEPIRPTDTIHVYAGWAKTGTPGDGVGGNFTIHRTGLPTSTYNKGDAQYNYWCSNSGGTIHNPNAWNPSCTSNTCSQQHPEACEVQAECLALNGTDWCAGTPRCLIAGSTSRRCCAGTVTNCDSWKDCESVGGVWNNGTCSDGSVASPLGLEVGFTVDENVSTNDAIHQ